MDEFNEKMNDIPEEIEDTAEKIETAENIEETAEIIPEKLENTEESVAEEIAEVTEEAKETVAEAAEEAKDAAANGFVPPYQPYNTAFGTAQPGAQAPQGAPVFNASGEYRYVPPYTPQSTPATVQSGGVRVQPAVAAAQPAVETVEHKKKKKEKKSFGAGAIALIVAACVLLSFGAGCAGAIIANNFGVRFADGNALVIYKTPASDHDEDAPSVSDKALTVPQLCAKVSDSVVEIDTEFKNTYGFYQYVSDGAGSGVIISADGYVVTNNHVIYNSETGKVADSVTVRLADGTEYDAEIIGRDADADIALLKVEASGLSPAVVGDSAKLTAGETVVAVGNPLGELGGTVTCGIVSATNREISVDGNKMNLIQIDAAVNPGNSGGGIFNTKGELVGIVNAKSSGSEIDGLGFAIPVNDAIKVVEEIRTHGYVTGKTHIGISLVDVTDMYTAYYYFRSQQTGVYVAQVEEGFNDKVLKYGDRIIAIDGNEVASSEDVKEAVKSHAVGETMKFSISRDGKFIDVTVTCYEYVPDKNVTFSEAES